MKQKIKTGAVLALMGLIFWRCSPGSEKGIILSTSLDTSTVHLPSDVLMLDTVGTTEFNSWFAKGTATPNGVVLPANSLAFNQNSTSTNVDFYKWSEQMFLWITSTVDNKKGIVLESPTFYTVVDNNDGTRSLSQNNFGKPIILKVNLPLVGPHGLIFIKDKKGNRFEVENEQENEGVIDGAGKKVELSEIRIDQNKALLFLDKSGKVISHPRPVITSKINSAKVVQRFKVGKKFIFLDSKGNQIDTEEGQAGGDNVLISQNGSVVYYMTMVNDVYAWYLTMFKDSTMKNVQQQFPTDTAGLNPIVAYAAKHGTTLKDANALAMEIKTSWVKASTLPDTSGYVIISASVPTFVATNDTTLTVGPDTTERMALVGMHVVGSVAGHPEMIWSTFEHQNNTPNAAYDYIDNKNKVSTVAADQTMNWLFSNGSINQNLHLMTFNPGKNGMPATITGDSIVAVNTLREAPWGAAKDSISNPIDTTAARSNSELISFNASIKKLLGTDDVRNNYLFIGATWTTGTAPNGNSYKNINNIAGASLGTSYLANSTMETATQFTAIGGGSCFTCHSSFGTPSLNPDSGLSHVFNDIRPLLISGKAAGSALKNKKALPKH